METRNVLDKDGAIIGSMSMPDGTSEADWTAALTRYSASAPGTPALSAQQALVEAGHAILLNFAARNVFEGLSADVIGTAVAQLVPIQVLLVSGNLSAALTLVQALTPGPVLTSQLIASFETQISNYLGV